MDAVRSLLEKLNQRLSFATQNSRPGELYLPISYTLSFGGKRIRPLLVLMGCDLYGGDVEKALDLAAGVEIFHNFTLLHDDIMDHAPVRRGKETVYKKWNTNIAILSGDTMFAIAYEYISHADPAVLPELLRTFTQTARQVCEGQQYDMNFETLENVTIRDYLEMIRLKTGVLIAASLKIGAIAAGAGMKEQENIYSFGENLGIAFQLQDDLLDTFGNGEKLGKEIGGDIVSNKKTFLYIKAMEAANEIQRKELRDHYSKRMDDPSDKIRKVKEIFSSLKIEENTKTEISRYYLNAIYFLDLLAAEEKKKNELRQMASGLLNRDF
ncbi:MAG: polyprenyl synthetase family protein [Bacteroidetes bacterium]|nr:polyprenyl synthetase family protein [Bacteroidota bacterium]